MTSILSLVSSPTGLSLRRSSPSPPLVFPAGICSTGGDVSRRSSVLWLSGRRELTTVVAKAGTEESEGVVMYDNEDGVSLGTMKLPLNIDLQRFENLLFQWANSLCQGAMLPLPVPLKVDKIPGGARLNFITIADGKTKVPVYIDCLVFSATGGSGPVFRAVRNGRMKDESPPGEQRIMRSLLPALQKWQKFVQEESFLHNNALGKGSLENAGVKLPAPARARKSWKWTKEWRITGKLVKP